MFLGVVGKNMADLCLSNPDDEKEDHMWRDEVLTMIVGVRYYSSYNTIRESNVIVKIIFWDFN